MAAYKGHFCSDGVSWEPDRFTYCISNRKSYSVTLLLLFFLWNNGVIFYTAVCAAHKRENPAEKIIWSQFSIFTIMKKAAELLELLCLTGNNISYWFQACLTVVKFMMRIYEVLYISYNIIDVVTNKVWLNRRHRNITSFFLHECYFILFYF